MPNICGYVICEDIYAHQFFGWFVSCHEKNEPQYPDHAARVYCFSSCEMSIDNPIQAPEANTEQKKHNKKLKHFLFVFLIVNKKLYIFFLGD